VDRLDGWVEETDDTATMHMLQPLTVEELAAMEARHG
jgi:hypothetical protein